MMQSRMNEAYVLLGGHGTRCHKPVSKELLRYLGLWLHALADTRFWLLDDLKMQSTSSREVPSFLPNDVILCSKIWTIISCSSHPITVCV